jgi:PAS domain S-box-containing protein
MDCLNIHDIPVGSVITSEHFSILEVNKTCTEILKTIGENLIDVPFISLFAEPKKIAELFTELEKNKELNDCDIELKNNEGKNLSWYISAKQIQINPVKYIILFTNCVPNEKLSNQFLVEKELKLYQEKLEELVKERTIELEFQTEKLKDSHQALSFLLKDINESRKELEESNRQISKLSQAVEQSPSTVVITDTEGNIEYVNNQFCNITGYAKDEVIGKNPRLLNSGFHPKEFFTNMWETIKSGREWHGEICNKRKNGEIYWEHSSVSPLRNPEQEITHFIAMKEDVTERKLTEDKLKKYTEELELFNKTMVDRELKIIEMKEEVNKLSRELGRGIVYPPLWNN